MSNKRDVFISYHTGSSAEVVAQICAALEGAGISCWYAPRDVIGDYATSIVRAINECRVFLLILNRDADVSEDVRNEINCAFERFRNHEEITLLPFRTDNFKLSEAIAYYIGRIHIMDGGIPPEMLKLRELVDRIMMILGRKAELTFTTDTPKGNTSYRLSSSMICADAKFVGRAAELSEIRASLHSSCNKMFIVGMGGIGKSELIRRYVQLHKDDYRLILWISFQHSLRETICNDSSVEIHGIRRQDYPEDSDYDFFLRKMQILRSLTDKNVLLILDNYDVDTDPDLDEFLKGEYSLLISTRNHQHHPYVPQLQVHAITDIGELRTIFFSEYTRIVDAQAQKQVDAILELLCGHPLSIRLVAATMQSRRIVPQAMYDMLRSGKEEMVRSNFRAAELIYGHLARIFQLSGLSGEEKILLCSLACMHLNGIGVEDFYAYCQMDDYEVIDRLIDKNWVMHNPSTDEVSLHPRIAELMKGEINTDPTQVQAIVNSIRDRARHHQNMTFQARCRLVDHVKNLYSLKLDNRYIRFVAAASLGYLSEGLNRQLGINLFLEALEMADDPKDKLECYVKISHNYTLSQQFEEGLAYALIGCAMLESSDIDETPPGYYRNKMWGRAGEALYFLGRYNESCEYLEKAVALCEECGIQEKGWTYYHLASAYRRRGSVLRAMEVAEQATQIFANIGDLWSIGHSFNLKTQIMVASGNYAQALEYQLSTRDTFLQVYGEEDSSFSSIHFRLGCLLRLIGKTEAAMDHFRHAKDVALKYNLHKQVDLIDSYIADPSLTQILEFM